ncbi:MAG: thiamine pyrophosphate-binding protein [Armatimonadetes bacterium]|nr:thiamine pyrophosphate-binding protein [Armatimonadota bacterium]
MKLTGGEIVAESLIAAGVPYVAGIPGHGCLGLTDAFVARRDKLRVLNVRQENAAVHLADGYYRTCGRPLAAFTSIGPGACNTVIGAATAYVDSTAVLILTGGTHVHMFGKGVLQEVERRRSSDFLKVLEPVVKRSWEAMDVRQLPFIMRHAFATMLTGRRGPVHVELPMCVQCEAADVAAGDLSPRVLEQRPSPDAQAVEQAAELLLSAKRPVILAGGGALYADAAPELRALAEHLGAAVLTTLAGKGVFPETHPLSGWLTGSKGTTIGLQLSRNADVILAVGCRFADETTCSYRRGIAFGIPPTKLTHLDLQPEEVGKNYPVEVGLVGDAKAGLAALLDAAQDRRPEPAADNAYTRQIAALREAWWAECAATRASDAVPVTMSRFLAEARAAIPMDAIVASSSGNTQAQILQEFPFEAPRTCLTTGGFSTMGWTLPAAMGARLAAPDRTVCGILGDGDFLMAVQELATAVQHQIPVTMIVANNQGFISIKDLQRAVYGEDRTIASDFAQPDGTVVSPHLADVARAFGCHAERVEQPAEVGPAIRRALQSGSPAVVEVMVDREPPASGGAAYGWWDVPVPTYLPEQRARYEAGRAEEAL